MKYIKSKQKNTKAVLFLTHAQGFNGTTLANLFKFLKKKKVTCRGRMGPYGQNLKAKN